MAIDLPPPLPPVLTIPATVVEASQTQGAYIRRLGDYALQLSGFHYLNNAELDQIFEQAKSPSEAIVLMNAWTHRRGHLLVQYVYTRPFNGVIHVRALQKTLGEISGDSAITQYFKSLEGEQAPSRAEFVHRRSQANLLSERTGVNYSVSYSERDDNREIVDMELNGVAAEQHSPWHGALQLGNQGSRFAGRYFANATLSRDFSTGTRLSAAYQTAIPEWGEAGEGEDFGSVQVKANQTSRFGVYELDLQQTEYDRQLAAASAPAASCASPLVLGQCLLPGSPGQAGNADFSADISQLALRGQQIASADLDRRLLFSQQVQWVDSTLEQDNGLFLQDEAYATLDVGSSYERAQAFSDKPLKWKLGLNLTGGLSGDSGTLGSDSTSEGVSIGKRTSKFITLKPSASMAYEFAPNYQFASSISAQLANEQVPQQQQWVLGGVSTMRAYLPGVLVGDSGVHISASLIRSAQFENSTLSFSLFAEYGAARYENASGKNNNGVSLGSFSTLADAGISATLKLWDHLDVSAVVARPLADSNVDSAQVDDAEADFFVVLKAHF